jgi:hypothetical protein
MGIPKPGAAMSGVKNKIKRWVINILYLFAVGAFFISWESNGYRLDWSLVGTTIRNFGEIVIVSSGLGDVAEEQLQAAKDYFAKSRH